jgi:integrase
MKMPSVSLFRPTVTRKIQVLENGQKAHSRQRAKTRLWWLKWRAPDGKVVTRKTDTADKSVARQIAREIERKLALEPYGLVDPADGYCNLDWQAFTEEYLRHVRAVSRPQTASLYHDSLEAFARLMQPKSLRSITLKSLQDFAAARMRQVLPATVNKDIRSLRAALRWAKGREYVREVPNFSGLLVREDQKDPVVIADGDIRAILSALERPDLHLTKRPAAWWRVYVQLLLYCGMRRGEALGLTWERINFDSGDITVHRSTSKGRKDRTYPGALDLVNLLGEWRDAQDPMPGPNDPVLPWVNATLRQMYVDWRRIVKAAGIPDDRRYVPKNYRSTCATQLLEAGESTLVVKDWLGHSTVQVTEKFYASTKEARRQAAARRQVVR